MVIYRNKKNKLNLENQYLFNSFFRQVRSRKVEDYELVSVEPYTPNNFILEQNIYDGTIFDNQYPTHYFLTSSLFER